MNGAEHYAEAERLIEAWQQAVDETSGADPTLAQQLADAAPMVLHTLLAANAHATLAMAASAFAPPIVVNFDGAVGDPAAVAAALEKASAVAR